jgi:predicted alpha/beta hydrolase
MVKEEELTIAARDGYSLGATRRRLDAEPSATVLIAAATAVPAGFYRRFASYLAERGFDTITFDYRGVGRSRPASLKGFDARMRDWADLDSAAAVDFAAALNPGKPLLYVGHSFGGQALGLLPNNTKVSRALLVASQVGYWRYVTGAFERYRVYASWCMKPGYLFDDETLTSRANFPNYKGAVRAVGMADDPWATPPAIARLLQGFTGTKPEHITILPRDAGAAKIGHFNFFRADFRDTLWKNAADWLSAK